MIHINEVIVVEGKYDKERLKKITDAPIVCTHGFSLYKSKKTIEILRKLSKDRGIIILTDSDGAGIRIRNYIKTCLGKSNIKNLYIPMIKGKEKRKEKPGAEGLLGVEGMDTDVLERILKQAAALDSGAPLPKITKAEFYRDGFSGGENSGKMRKKLAESLLLPCNLSANAMLEMINTIYGAEKYRQCVKEILSK